MMFECDKCGECCTNLKYSSLYADLDRGDGTCKYLKDNLCSIYEQRPVICRVDESYDIFFRARMTKADYYRLNYQCCDKLKGRRN